MREQALPLTQAPDLLELRLAETLNSKEHGDVLKTIEQLPYPFNIVNLKSAHQEKEKPQAGKVFFLTEEEYSLLEKKIPKWTDSWFVLLEETKKERSYPESGNFFVLDGKTKVFIPKLLDLINLRFCEEKKLGLVDSALKNSKVLSKEAVKFLDEYSDDSVALDCIEELLRVYGEFFIVEEKEELEKLIKKANGKTKIIKSVQLFEDLDELIDQDKGGGMILPLVEGEKVAIALYRFPKKISPAAPFYTYFLHCLISVSYRKLNPVSVYEENDLWQEAFSKLPIPCALVTEKGELILHNSSFSKINISPGALLKLKNGEKTEIEGRVYELKKIEVEHNQQSHVLLMLASGQGPLESASNGQKSGSSEELGIISSSIAHELNNPLAGILATIAVLELEDEWLEDPEVTQALKEMNQSARRCKDLIEIFLGFSKAQPNKGDANHIDDIFKKSLELIRFRTIESNVRFDFDFKQLGSFDREVNNSVVSMMFYLILNEMLTSFSHHKLISHDEDNFLAGSFIEQSNKVIIEMEKEFGFNVQIEDSKLIQHLLDLLGMDLNVDGRKIVLSEWTLT